MGNQGSLGERWITSPELLEKIEERLEDLDQGIQALARTWARDNPDVWEDLAQEARLAIYLELKENPESPPTHLFQRARHVILDYRKKGRSVDGKLHRAFGRPHVWKLASLDGDPKAPLAIRSRRVSPVEDLALARVAYGELRERLTGPQTQYLALRIQGYQGREVDCLLGLTKKQGFYLRKKIKQAAQECLMDQIIAGSEVPEAVSQSGGPTSPTWSETPRNGRPPVGPRSDSSPPFRRLRLEPQPGPT